MHENGVWLSRVEHLLVNGETGKVADALLFFGFYPKAVSQPVDQALAAPVPAAADTDAVKAAGGGS